MSKFKSSFTKVSINGVKIPKGRGELIKFKKENPGVFIFDSKSEYERYLELKDMETKGLIGGLKLQVKFVLIPSGNWCNNVTGKNTIVREACYIADFMYTENGVSVVEDCKGWKQTKKNGEFKWSVYTDDVYKLKKKIFLSRYPEYIFKES